MLHAIVPGCRSLGIVIENFQFTRVAIIGAGVGTLICTKTYTWIYESTLSHHSKQINTTRS